MTGIPSPRSLDRDVDAILADTLGVTGEQLAQAEADLRADGDHAAADAIKALRKGDRK